MYVKFVKDYEKNYILISKDNLFWVYDNYFST